MNRIINLFLLVFLGFFLVSCAQYKNFFSKKNTVHHVPKNNLVVTQVTSMKPLSEAFSNTMLTIYLDKQDHANIAEAALHASLGQEAMWQNTKFGTTCLVRPIKDYFLNQKPCRDIVGMVAFKTNKIRAQTTICREKNGVWWAVR